MIVKCWFCGKEMHVSEYDFARWSKGECILCDLCDVDFNNNKSKTIRL